jgi:hypothetical protein
MKVKFHMNAESWVHFGGEISCVSAAYIGVLQGALLVMAPRFPFGMICGLIQFCQSSSPYCTPLPKAIPSQYRA